MTLVWVLNSVHDFSLFVNYLFQFSVSVLMSALLTAGGDSTVSPPSKSPNLSPFSVFVDIIFDLFVFAVFLLFWTFFSFNKGLLFVHWTSSFFCHLGQYLHVMGIMVVC